MGNLDFHNLCYKIRNKLRQKGKPEYTFEEVLKIGVKLGNTEGFTPYGIATELERKGLVRISGQNTVKLTKRFYVKNFKNWDLSDIDMGDWIQNIGLIETYNQLKTIREFWRLFKNAL